MISILTLLAALHSSIVEAAPSSAIKKPKVVTAGAAKVRPGAAARVHSSSATKGAKSVVSQKLPKGSKLFLWKMTSDDGATIFFLGTIHVARKSFYPLPDEVEKAFAKSQELLVEADISDKKSGMAEDFKQKGTYAKGDNLANHISESTMRALQKYCAATDISEEPFMQMKPWMVQLAIGGIEIRRLGFLGKNGIDLHFINMANKEGKKVVGLEKDHNDVFAGIDPDLQDKMLRLSLRNADLLAPDSIEKMMKIWKAGDTNGMAEISTKELKKDPGLAPAEDRILYDRNQKMADTIEPYLKKAGVYMVAVGSAHLVGDRNIIEILEKRGYKVHQVLVGDEI